MLLLLLPNVANAWPREVAVQVRPRLALRANVGLTEVRLDDHLHVAQGFERAVPGDMKLGGSVGSDSVRLQASITHDGLTATMSNEWPYQNPARIHETKASLRFSYDPQHPGREIEMGETERVVPVWSSRDAEGHVHLGVVRQQFCLVTHDVGPLLVRLRLEQPSHVAVELLRRW